MGNCSPMTLVDSHTPPLALEQNHAEDRHKGGNSRHPQGQSAGAGLNKKNQSHGCSHNLQLSEDQADDCPTSAFQRVRVAGHNEQTLNVHHSLLSRAGSGKVVITTARLLAHFGAPGFHLLPDRVPHFPHSLQHFSLAAIET